MHFPALFVRKRLFRFESFTRRFQKIYQRLLCVFVCVKRMFCISMFFILYMHTFRMWIFVRVVVLPSFAFAKRFRRLFFCCIRSPNLLAHDLEKISLVFCISFFRCFTLTFFTWVLLYTHAYWFGQIIIPFPLPIMYALLCCKYFVRVHDHISCGVCVCKCRCIRRGVFVC